MTKKALCIGINDYPDTGMDLSGCVNDAEDWAAALTAHGFQTRRLIDGAATKAGMVTAIESLVKDARSGDSLVITYSGHGTYAPDRDSDEPDGLDEALCPYDIRTAGALIDDEIHRLFAARSPGVRILLISDSCHSGTVTRAAPRDPDAVGARPRFLPMGAWLKEAELPRSGDGRVMSRVALTNTASPWAGAVSLANGDDLLLAGCEEGPNNFSYDASFRNRPNGAFTYYALKALRMLDKAATYAAWHAEIRKNLPSASYPQTPQIFGSKRAQAAKVLA